MSWQLVVLSGPDAGTVIPLAEGTKQIIGRDPECSLRLADPSVSREHCELRVAANAVELVDLGSRWGTLVNEQKVDRKRLHPGDVVTIGDTRLEFRSTVAAVESTLPLESPPVPEAEFPGPPPMQELKVVEPTIERLESLVGQKFARFDVERIIAQGASGVVFRAVDTRTPRTVALKVLWPDICRKEEEIKRFVRAIRAMCRIQHPNLIRLYAAGRSRGLCWMATEFVDGESLSEVIQRIGIRGMLDWRVAFRVILQVARALEFAHEHGIVHRNITPRNVLMRANDGLVKLGDLMLAKSLEGSNAEVITRKGELVGQLLYMSPEQTGRETIVDHRSDIYNLGAMAYALLTGHPPFEGHSPLEIIMKIQRDPPAKPTKFHLSIPPLFEGVVLQMLAKRPDDRYRSPTHLITDLQRVAKYLGTEER